MESFLEQIEKGLDCGVYQLSLSMALCLPDICGALESVNGYATGKKYKAWFDKYVSSKYNGNLTGSDCYYFRCAFLHQGTTEHEKSSYKKILFIEPHQGLILHNNVMNDALNIDINIFCRDIISGVKEWLKEIQDSEQFKINMEKTFRRYPNGLPPYIGGIPVYA